ncbi:hypothetical protein, partial [Thiolapillus sp.]|uniref:hypothetical protein n=1 Tax=Thiolapillus sp. TaxID=2017437 RepID=UPI003AF9EB67
MHFVDMIRLRQFFRRITVKNTIECGQRQKVTEGMGTITEIPAVKSAKPGLQAVSDFGRAISPSGVGVHPAQD